MSVLMQSTQKIPQNNAELCTYYKGLALTEVFVKYLQTCCQKTYLNHKDHTVFSFILFAMVDFSFTYSGSAKYVQF